jgi:hypothetical protein
MGWDGMGGDGMGWDGMGWDGMGWDGMGRIQAALSKAKAERPLGLRWYADVYGCEAERPRNPPFRIEIDRRALGGPTRRQAPTHNDS